MQADDLRGISAMHKLTSIWREVSGWPPEERLELVMRLLQSLRQEQPPVVVSKERQEALRRLIGVWKTEQPPTDEQVEEMLKQERIKKYG